MALVWGYKPDGQARLFDLEDGASLSEGWSDDHCVITDPAKSTGEAITAAAGVSVRAPVKIAAAPELGPDAAEVHRRGPGRPPNSERGLTQGRVV